MNPAMVSPCSATMPMQFRWRRQRRKSSSVQAYSKLARSVRITSGMSRRIIHRMWTPTTPLSLGRARPVLMNGLLPPDPTGAFPRRPGREAVGMYHSSRTPLNPTPAAPAAGNFRLQICDFRLKRGGGARCPSIGNHKSAIRNPSLLVEPRALLLDDRGADLVGRQLHPEPDLAGDGPADAHPVDRLALHPERRDRVEQE